MFKQLSITALVLTAATPLAAADPKFTFGKAEEVKDVKEPEWTAAAEAGVVFTTGNSETTTATGGLKASRKAGSDKLAIELSAAYARSAVLSMDDRNGNGTIDDETEITTTRSTTAQTLASKLRYDRFLTEFNSLFAAVLAGRDVPAGKESVIGAQLGYSRQLFKSKTSEAVAEIGYDFSREALVDSDAVAIHSARTFVGLKSALSEGVDLDTSIEALTNLNKETLPTGRDGRAFRDTRLNAKLALSAKVGKDLAVQTALEARFDNRPGPLQVKNLADGFVPEASRLDTIMKASLIYSF